MFGGQFRGEFSRKGWYYRSLKCAIGTFPYLQDLFVHIGKVCLARQAIRRGEPDQLGGRAERRNA